MSIGANQRGTTLHFTQYTGNASFRLTTGSASTYPAHAVSTEEFMGEYPHKFVPVHSTHRLSETNHHKIVPIITVCNIKLEQSLSAEHALQILQYIDD